MSYERSWGDHLSREVQFRCKICPDAVGGTADIACADAWYGGEGGYPPFAEKDGRSLIMARSTVARTFLDNTVATGRMQVQPLGKEEIYLKQHAPARSKGHVEERVDGRRKSQESG